MPAPYPWQAKPYANLERLMVQGRLPHALLLTGEHGLGKHQFAQHLAASLLCSKTTDLTLCGACSACRLVVAGTHPDLHTVDLEVSPKDGKVAKEIKVDQIRALSEALTLTSQQGHYKVAVIANAHSMNINAANSLLKTLEEPTQNTVLMLVTHAPSQLLPTIRSRCQAMNFAVPSNTEARQWLADSGMDAQKIAPLLALANGAPIRALQASERGWIEQREQLFSLLHQLADKRTSAIEAAKIIASMDLNACLEWMVSWTVDVQKMRQGVLDEHMSNQDCVAMIKSITPRVNSHALNAWYEHLLTLMRWVQRPLNAQQWLEACLIEWQQVFDTP